MDAEASRFKSVSNRFKWLLFLVAAVASGDVFKRSARKPPILASKNMRAHQKNNPQKNKTKTHTHTKKKEVAVRFKGLQRVVNHKDLFVTLMGGYYHNNSAETETQRGSSTRSNKKPPIMHAEER